MPLPLWNCFSARRVAQASPARGGVRLAVEQLGDRVTPAALYATGADAGSAPVVTAYDAATNQQKFTVTAYDPAFTGGVSVAVGDVNGDGTPDVVTGAGPGGGPVVNVYSGTDGTLLKTFLAGDADSRAGVTVAAADFNGDGHADVVAGTLAAGQPQVQVFSGADGSVLHTYTPFGGTSAPSVAAGDLNGDGTPDVVAGSGAGGAPRVAALDGATGATLLDLFTFEETFTGGVTVAAGDLNGDGRADVITAAGNLGGPRVQVFSGLTAAPLLNFFAYDDAQRAGVRASAADANADGRLDLVTAGGVGQAADVQAFDGTTGAAMTAPSFAALPSGAATAAAPTATVAAGSGPSRTSPLAFTVTFNEAVNGFTAAGVTATNGTVAGVVRVDGRTYTVTVTPVADGPVTAAVAAGAATSAAGVPNTASAPASQSYDATAPAVTATAQTAATGAPTLSGTVDDPAAAVTVTAGGQSVAATVTGSTWTAALPTALTDGTYDISVTATDAAGNAGTATQAGGLVVDTAAPTAVVTSAAPEPTADAPIPFTVTFDEPVTGFIAAGVTVTNGTVASLAATDARTYAVGVTPTGAGAVAVAVAAGAARDAAGNANAASAAAARTYAPAAATTAGPTATLATTAADPTNAATLPVTLAFGGDVSGVMADDVAVANGTLTSFVAVDARTYALNVAPAADGPVTVSVAAGAGVDAAGDPTGAAALTVASDRTPPVATVSPPAPAAAALVFTVAFSEDVAGVTAAGFTATNGAVGAVTAVDARTYQVAVTPAAAGAVTLTLAAGTATDAAGNPTAAAASASVTPAAPAASAVSATIPSLTADGWTAAADGLRTRDVAVGSGTPVAAGSTVTVRYTGWLTDGTVFDSNADSATPATFALDGLIPGWQEGLVGMQPGGVRDLDVPAALGYGSQAAGSIPANSELVFEVQLVAVS